MEFVHGRFTFKLTKKMWSGELAALKETYYTAPSCIAKETLLLRWSFDGIGDLVWDGIPVKVLKWANQLDNIVLLLGRQRDTKTYRSAKDYMKLALDGLDGRGYHGD